MTRRLLALLPALLLVACPRPGDDDDDTPDPNFDPAFLPQGATPPQAPTKATVDFVIDGDTGRFELDGGFTENVRFLSIDTPEMNAGNNDPPECFAEEATARSVALLPEGATVWLTWDGEYSDSFDRLLCYIFVGETPSVDSYEDWVNLTLVDEGYARAFIFDNNQTFRSVFEDAEQSARDADRGRWGDCGF